MFRAAVGAVLFGLVGLAVVLWARRRWTSSAGVHPALAPHRISPWVLAVAALGALIALTTVPLGPEPRPSGNQGKQAGPGDVSNDPNAPTKVRVGDRDGDGELDTTTEDGKRLVPCPADTPGSVPPLRPGVTAVDIDCDGEIDGYVEVIIDEAKRPSTTPAPATTVAQPQDRAEPVMSKITFFIILGIAVAAVLAWLFRGFVRRKPPVATLSEQHAALDTAVDTAIGFAETDPDPRQAIIAAYGHLLTTLESTGGARLAHEAPREHLRRCLRIVRVGERPFTELVGLFEVARFSSNPVSEADRGNAIAALRSARGELGVVDTERDVVSLS